MSLNLAKLTADCEDQTNMKKHISRCSQQLVRLILMSQQFFAF
jgi:hypothetical protein